MEQATAEDGAGDCNGCSERVRQLEAAVGELRGQLAAARRDAGQRLSALEESKSTTETPPPPRARNGNHVPTTTTHQRPSGSDHHSPRKKARVADDSECSHDPRLAPDNSSSGFSSFPTTATSESQGVNSSYSAPTETSQYYFSSIMSSSVDSTTDRDGAPSAGATAEAEKGEGADASAPDDKARTSASTAEDSSADKDGR